MLSFESQIKNVGSSVAGDGFWSALAKLSGDCAKYLDADTTIAGRSGLSDFNTVLGLGVIFLVAVVLPLRNMSLDSNDGYFEDYREVARSRSMRSVL